MAINLNNQPMKQWPLSKIEACQKQTGVPFLTSQEILVQASKDFGGLVEGHPVGVAFPHTSTDISALLHFAKNHDLSFTIRSGGYSQGGQTLAPKGGATLDCSQMTKINSPDLTARTLTCQPGATWGQVVDITAPFGLLPKVMPFFPNLTIGGVLSIGGIGGNSHLYGCVSANALELEVVTGTSEIKVCNRTQEPDLFEATLCGLGRCSVITEATIQLRPFKSKMITYYLMYTDHKSWLADIQTLWMDYECDFLEAFCTPSLQGLHKQNNSWKPLPCWFYNLQVSFEYETDEDIIYHQKILDGLHYWQLLHKEVSNTLEFVGRYGVRAQNMKDSGTWNHSHPWLECMLPIDQLCELLPELLTRLPLSLGDGLGYRLFFVSRQENNPQSFRMPGGSSPVVGIAVLPSSVTIQNRSTVLESLEQVHHWLISLGGKRCLAGWLGSNPADFWPIHFEDYYSQWALLKSKYDPNNVLQSVLLQSFIYKNKKRMEKKS